tara:strand:- start:305 stop:517 length:213 start_codon:yes stop_codon:yes gene_type:complete
MMSRQEYNKAYYEINKEKLKEYNKNRQRVLYSEEETREKKREQNRKRYKEQSYAYKQVKDKEIDKQKTVM